MQAGSISGGRFQSGLWGMHVSQVRYIERGESTYHEVESVPIQSVLPLMADVNHGMGNQSVGGRCAAMADLRYTVVHSLHRPNSNYERLSPAAIMRDVNTEMASEYSQRTLMRMLAIQLIGAGYEVGRQCEIRNADPRAKPLMGAPGGFQGYEGGKVLLNGLATRKSQVQKMAVFMESVRGLAREYLAAHESFAGDVIQLTGSDQLAHRARLLLLAADPQRLQAQPEIVHQTLATLNTYEAHSIVGDSDADEASRLVTALVQAKANLLPDNSNHSIF